MKFAVLLLTFFLIQSPIPIKADKEIEYKISNKFESIRSLDICRFKLDCEIQIRKIEVSSWGSDFVILEADTKKQILEIRIGSNNHSNSLKNKKSWKTSNWVVPLNQKLYEQIEELKKLPVRGISNGNEWQFDAPSYEYETKTLLSSCMVRHIGEPTGHSSKRWKEIDTQLSELIKYCKLNIEGE